MAINNYQLFQTQIAGKSDKIIDIVPVLNSTGDWATVEDINALINFIRNLLLTPLGYYPFDPEFGSLLYKQLFEMADDITKDKIRYEVEARVKKYVPLAKIIDVQVSMSNNKKLAVVNVIIDRNGIKGKVEVILSARQAMFGLEDNITNMWLK